MFLKRYVLDRLLYLPCNPKKPDYDLGQSTYPAEMRCHYIRVVPSYPLHRFEL